MADLRKRISSGWALKYSLLSESDLILLFVLAKCLDLVSTPNEAINFSYNGEYTSLLASTNDFTIFPPIFLKTSCNFAPLSSRPNVLIKGSKILLVFSPILSNASLALEDIKSIKPLYSLRSPSSSLISALKSISYIALSAVYNKLVKTSEPEPITALNLALASLALSIRIWVCDLSFSCFLTALESLDASSYTFSRSFNDLPSYLLTILVIKFSSSIAALSLFCILVLSAAILALIASLYNLGLVLYNSKSTVSLFCTDLITDRSDSFCLLASSLNFLVCFSTSSLEVNKFLISVSVRSLAIGLFIVALLLLDKTAPAA